MPDQRPSAFSRILRLLAVEPSPDEKVQRERDDERTPSAAEIERKFSQRDEAFFWTWQYPGQW
jgi:hypothetical protein